MRRSPAVAAALSVLSVLFAMSAGTAQAADKPTPANDPNLYRPAPAPTPTAIDRFKQRSPALASIPSAAVQHGVLLTSGDAEAARRSQPQSRRGGRRRAPWPTGQPVTTVASATSAANPTDASRAASERTLGSGGGLAGLLLAFGIPAIAGAAAIAAQRLRRTRR